MPTNLTLGELQLDYNSELSNNTLLSKQVQQLSLKRSILRQELNEKATLKKQLLTTIKQKTRNIQRNHKEAINSIDIVELTNRSNKIILLKEAKDYLYKIQQKVKLKNLIENTQDIVEKISLYGHYKNIAMHSADSVAKSAIPAEEIPSNQTRKSTGNTRFVIQG